MTNFDWTDYLKRTNSIAVPEELFEHVEASIRNDIEKGMLLEVCHRSNPDTYWIAEITMVCGHLLRIKFIGAESDFWCDISNTKVHPLGWCGKYDEQIEPPDEINERYGDKIIDMMRSALFDGQSVSFDALKNKGLAPIDRIKPGMKVEVQNLMDPYKYWIATVCANVGGRLQLRYDGCDEELPDFWLFYNNQRLAYFGYVTSKGSPWQFKYPGKVNKYSCANKLSALLRQCAEEAIKEPAPQDVFMRDQSHLEVHNFVLGMKLEALDPGDMRHVRPATVIKVFNKYQFLVCVEERAEECEAAGGAWLCGARHPYVYPASWAAAHGLPFQPPAFRWDHYLASTSAVPAPDYCFTHQHTIKELQINMKLEAVNPLNDSEIHVASICAISAHMVCVELDSNGQRFWYSARSDQLFPVGWCDSNAYPLHVPTVREEPTPAVREESTVRDVPAKSGGEEKVQPPREDLPRDHSSFSTEEWCDRIFFNYKCYAGPSISRNKLSQLPKHVGPGPLSLVLKEVLNKLISASYKPGKLLRDWEAEGPPPQGMRLEMLKAKLKARTYYAYVAVAASRALVAQFCRSVCARLNACPHLFCASDFADACPEACQTVDKAKFRNTVPEAVYVERRGRPKGSFKKKRPKPTDKKEPPAPDHHTNKDGGESVAESEHSGSTPPSDSETQAHSDTGANCEVKADDSRANSETRANSPDTKPKEHSSKKPRAAKLPVFPQHNKPHWQNKADYQKHSIQDSDTDHESSRSSTSKYTRNISEVSDQEEPELKRLKFNPNDPLPTNDRLLDNCQETWTKGKLQLAENPIDWSIDDVHAYLSNTDDCKQIADKMKEEEIDGEAFIMLDLPVLRQFLHLKKDYALKVCKHITMLKWYYIVNNDDART